MFTYFVGKSLWCAFIVFRDLSCSFFFNVTLYQISLLSFSFIHFYVKLVSLSKYTEIFSSFCVMFESMSLCYIRSHSFLLPHFIWNFAFLFFLLPLVSSVWILFPAVSPWCDFVLEESFD